VFHCLGEQQTVVASSDCVSNIRLFGCPPTHEQEFELVSENPSQTLSTLLQLELPLVPVMAEFESLMVLRMTNAV